MLARWPLKKCLLPLGLGVLSVALALWMRDLFSWRSHYLGTWPNATLFAGSGHGPYLSYGAGKLKDLESGRDLAVAAALPDLSDEAVLFSPDASLLMLQFLTAPDATGHFSRTMMIDVCSRRVLWDCNAGFMAFSPDSKVVLLFSNETSTLEVHSATTGQLLHPVTPPNQTVKTVFSADSKSLYCLDLKGTVWAMRAY